MQKPLRIALGIFLFAGMATAIVLNRDEVSPRIVTPVDAPARGAWVAAANEEITGFLGTVTRIEFDPADSSGLITVAGGSSLTATVLSSADLEAGPGHSRLKIRIAEGQSIQLELYQPAPDLLLVSDHRDSRSFTTATAELHPNQQ